ncbi:MAG TPA: hypothetical protein VGB37_10910, partial [Candidatus Lokiarchaeia archaeon]
LINLILFKDPGAPKMPIIMNFCITFVLFLTIWNKIDFQTRLTKTLSGIFKYSKNTIVIVLPFLAGSSCFVYFTLSSPMAKEDARAMIMLSAVPYILTGIILGLFYQNEYTNVICTKCNKKYRISKSTYNSEYICIKCLKLNV